MDSKGKARTAQTTRLGPDDGVIELAGPEPIWLGVYTCPAPRCRCREAVLVATREGREVLLERAAPIRQAWTDGSNYTKASAEVDDLLAFIVNIDSVAAHPVDNRERLDLAEHPEVRTVVERIDGEVLDAIGRLWLRGKGRPDPEQQAELSQEIVVAGWKPGDRVAWNSVLGGVRRDLYLLSDRVYEASELYCSVPDCDCGEVLVRFETSMPRGGPRPGTVTVDRSGTTTLDPHKNGGELLKQLWSAFQERHPRYAERFERRSKVMKSMSSRIATKPQARRP